MISVTGIPAFQDNYIWLISTTKSPYVALVDPGEAAPVLKMLNEKDLQLSAILITHHHHDHTGAITELVSHFDVPVYGPANERIPHISNKLSEGDVVTLAHLDVQFKVIDTPGHTAGHICYYGHDALFCGDTLFAGGCGRLFEGTAEQMQLSLEKIRNLPDNTLVYCAHEYTLANLQFARHADPGNQDLVNRQNEAITLRNMGKPTVPSPLELEKRTNPFLRWDNPALIQAAKEFTKQSLSTHSEVFGAIRYWKDTLD
jgi:hydroxyacylglutathione hydrolase